MVELALDYTICKQSPQTTTTSNKQQPLANIIFHSTFFLYNLFKTIILLFVFILSHTNLGMSEIQKENRRGQGDAHGVSKQKNNERNNK